MNMCLYHLQQFVGNPLAGALVGTRPKKIKGYLTV